MRKAYRKPGLAPMPNEMHLERTCLIAKSGMGMCKETFAEQVKVTGCMKQKKK